MNDMPEKKINNIAMKMLQIRLSRTRKLRVKDDTKICLPSIHVDMTFYIIIRQYKNEMRKMTYSFHTDLHQIGSTTECDYKRGNGKKIAFIYA